MPDCPIYHSKFEMLFKITKTTVCVLFNKTFSIALLPFKGGQNKGNKKPETDVSESTEYNKKYI